MDYDVDPIAGHAEQMTRLDQFQSLVHHGGTIDGDLRTHPPVRMSDRLGRRYRGHGGKITLAEWTSRGGQNDAVNSLCPLKIEHLKDRIVLAVHRQHRCTMPSDFLGHERPRT